jgi:small GTP-binding protein
MVETVFQQDSKVLLARITALHKKFNSNQDIATAKKARQLALKLQEKEYSVAFCGHFSAGKSSMINKIVGENILPSSPIPTSANLVKIKSGEEYAKVLFKKGKPRLYPAPYNYETVKTFCKDGDQIESIEISHNTEKIPENAVILDTPGIDSTDDAHRIATESALHLADLVFYVMDYNHVQSELNFLFTKELTEAGKEVYLVINQIDKHKEEELSFEEFKRSVKDSFASWGVLPAEIFYTSLKMEEHPHNCFLQLQQFIQSKLADREELLPQSAFHSLKKLIAEHQSFLEQQDLGKQAQYDELLAQVSQEEQQTIMESLEKAEKELNTIESVLLTRENILRDGVDNVLKNAYLMPFQTRELAEAYLQARQADFKVGLFFAKQKTEQERQTRLENFFADFQEKVKSQLEWHLKELLLNTIKSDELKDQTLISKIQGFHIPITTKVVEEAVKTGALLSGDYVLNYTSDVAEEAKKIARRQIREIQERYRAQLKIKQMHRKEELEGRRNQLADLRDALQQKQHLLEKRTASLIQMEQIVTGHLDEQLLADFTDEFPAHSEEVEVMTESIAIEKAAIEQEPKEMRRKPLLQIEKGNRGNDKVLQTVERLSYAAKELANVPGFKKMTRELMDKAERLGNRGFTVALFGAFSAGKSSFANALIGEKLLPVSPNPTTAAINKILPVDKKHPHGTVKVQLKQSDTLFADVNRSLGVFELRAANFDEAIELIKKVTGHTAEFDSHEKTHFAFLTAFQKGFPEYRTKLGEALYTDVAEFREFVANEEKSCLVEEIEVFFDCELTRKGITLVDTPGADSINARHTGVAFEYIKNSDAILFVTYYNHAFSKADREFLIQLGRVKDTFELDKMFFVVNAVDLANDEQEKEQVLNYVEDQLITFGIRQPSLFPISSLLAIKEKLERSSSSVSGIDVFEGHFYSFITHDLTDIAVNSAELHLNRAIEQLRSYIHSAKEDNHLKLKRMTAFKEEQRQVEENIKGQSMEVYSQRLNQEIDELTYYIKQRVFYRFGDFFKESFNPAVLKDDGRNLKKTLQHALEGFLTDFGFDFAQELRATTLRVETFIGKLLAQSFETLKKELSNKNQELLFSPYQIEKMVGVDFESAFLELDRELFKKALSFFKNPKSFFENNEKRFMMEELEKVLQEPADAYLKEGNERLKFYYHQEMLKEADALKRHVWDEANEYYEGMYATLSNEIPVEQLTKLENRIVNFS